MATSQQALVPITELPVAQTDDGPITVVAIDYLAQVASEAKAKADRLAAETTLAVTQSNTALANAGEILVNKRTSWDSNERAARIDAAAGLVTLVGNLQQSLSDVTGRQHHGLGGLVDRMRDSREQHEIESKLASAQAELVIRYRDVAADLNPPTHVDDADQALTAAAAARTTAADLAKQSAIAADQAKRLDDELQRRRSVVRELGFDALGIQADLQANGIRPIDTNLVLKPREVAAYQTPAVLCRFATRTQYVGGSQGVSIPLGHGFRYRISSFRGQPIQSQYLAEVDTGQLVVTNIRLVFIGAKRDVATPLAKLVSVEPYSDAIGIGREGKESRDIYRIARPAELVLYLDWVVGRQS